MTTTTTEDKIKAGLAALGLTITSEFVPQSKITHNDKWRGINWNVTLNRNDRAVLTTRYSAGIAHCPSYDTKPPSNWNHTPRMWQDAVCEFECEAGFKATYLFREFRPDRSKPILPKPEGVVYNLLFDAEVLDYATFEDWADNCGFDTDSRKAEQTYRACLEIALKMRAGLGDEGLRKLAELFEDY